MISRYRLRSLVRVALLRLVVTIASCATSAMFSTTTRSSLSHLAHVRVNLSAGVREDCCTQLHVSCAERCAELQAHMRVLVEL
jgi:hypothetical protein